MLGGVTLVSLPVASTMPCSVLIFWVSPFVTAASGLIAGALAMMLARSFRHDESSGGGVSKGGRFFILGVCLAMASLWVSASIAGASGSNCHGLEVDDCTSMPPCGPRRSRTW